MGNIFFRRTNLCLQSSSSSLNNICNILRSKAGFAVPKQYIHHGLDVVRVEVGWL